MKRLMALLLALLVLCPAGAGPLAARTDGPAAVAEAQDGEAAHTLKYGDQGDEVARLQERLSELGYYSGRISGNFLEGTQNGVKRFQTDYGLEITGELDPESAAALESAKYRALRYGDDGDDVKRLQQYLKDLKYLDAKATGKYRAATQAAVKEFQEAIGLEATGEADLDTQRELFSGQHLAKGAQPTPTPAPDADLGDINDVVIAGDGESTADSEGGNEYVKKLSRGAKGAEVKEVQTRLTELGFGGLPVCVAKTQYSFSDDPKKLGAPENFTITVRNVKVSAGAGFLVALTGEIMTMPGLPKVPAAERIDVDETGKISGLF